MRDLLKGREFNCECVGKNDGMDSFSSGYPEESSRLVFKTTHAEHSIKSECMSEGSRTPAHPTLLTLSTYGVWHQEHEHIAGRSTTPHGILP